MKCEICHNKIEEIFLGKIQGTLVKKPGSRQTYALCQDCQKKHRTKEEILKLI